MSATERTGIAPSGAVGRGGGSFPSSLARSASSSRRMMSFAGGGADCTMWGFTG